MYIPVETLAIVLRGDVAGVLGPGGGVETGVLGASLRTTVVVVYKAGKFVSAGILIGKRRVADRGVGRV